MWLKFQSAILKGLTPIKCQIQYRKSAAFSTLLVYQFLRIVVFLAASSFVNWPAVSQAQPGGSAQVGALVLTPQERLWLGAHPIVRIGIDSDYAPYESINASGQLVGMAADYLRFLEIKLGVRFEVVSDRPWTEILAMAKRGELDMLTSAVNTPERSRYLIFTPPYKSSKVIIIDMGDEGFHDDMTHLKGKRIALEEGYFMQELLEKDHPEVALVLAGNTKDALNLVIKGKADAYVGDAGAANFTIRKFGLTSLQFSGQTQYQSAHGFAVSKVVPELASIVTKAMASISQRESDDIVNRWLELKIEPGIKFETVAKYSAGVLGVLFFMAFWLLRLEREIAMRKHAQHTLSESEARIRTIIDSAPDAVVQINSTGVITGWNRTAERIFGWTRLEAMGRTIENTIIPPRHQDAHVQGLARYLRSGNSHIVNSVVEIHAQHRDGHEFAVELVVTQLNIDGGQEFNAFVRDITERNATADKIRKSEALYRLLTEDVQDVVWKLSRDFHVTYISPADEQLRGFRADEVLDHHISEMFTVEGAAVFEKIMRAEEIAESQGIQNETLTFEVQYRCKDGRLLWGEVLSKHERDAGGVLIGFHGITREITQRKLMEEQVRRLAFYDTLTDLPNRRLLCDRINQAMAASKRSGRYGALMFLDLDNFKPLNDKYGHAFGDLLLIEAADRMKKCVRATDTVARIGGDEFVVMLSDLNADIDVSTSQAMTGAENIRVAVSQPYILTVKHEGQADTVVQHLCTASIGVALFLAQEASQTDVLKWADAAMYEAKKAGRNLIRFSDPNISPPV